jgi:hypothetical protein
MGLPLFIPNENETFNFVAQMRPINFTAALSDNMQHYTTHRAVIGPIYLLHGRLSQSEVPLKPEDNVSKIQFLHHCEHTASPF